MKKKKRAGEQIETGEATKIFESVKNQLVNRKVNEKVMERKKAKL